MSENVVIKSKCLSFKVEPQVADLVDALWGEKPYLSDLLDGLVTRVAEEVDRKLCGEDDASTPPTR